MLLISKTNWQFLLLLLKCKYFGPVLTSASLEQEYKQRTQPPASPHSLPKPGSSRKIRSLVRVWRPPAASEPDWLLPAPGSIPQDRFRKRPVQGQEAGQGCIWGREFLAPWYQHYGTGMWGIWGGTWAPVGQVPVGEMWREEDQPRIWKECSPRQGPGCPGLSEGQKSTDCISWDFFMERVQNITQTKNTQKTCEVFYPI